MWESRSRSDTWWQLPPIYVLPGDTANKAILFLLVIIYIYIYIVYIHLFTFWRFTEVCTSSDNLRKRFLHLLLFSSLWRWPRIEKSEVTVLSINFCGLLFSLLPVLSKDHAIFCWCKHYTHIMYKRLSTRFVATYDVHVIILQLCRRGLLWVDYKDYVVLFQINMCDWSEESAENNDIFFLSIALCYFCNWRLDDF